jgi:hypothetical protein
MDFFNSQFCLEHFHPKKVALAILCSGRAGPRRTLLAAGSGQRVPVRPWSAAEEWRATLGTVFGAAVAAGARVCVRPRVCSCECAALRRGFALLLTQLLILLPLADVPDSLRSDRRRPVRQGRRPERPGPPALQRLGRHLLQGQRRRRL